MPLRLDARAADFEARFAAFLGSKREAAEDVDSAVAGIIEDVRERGDAAVVEYTKRFDGVDLRAEDMRVEGRRSGPSLRGVRSDDLGGVATRRRADPRLPRAAAAGRSRLYRRRWRAAGLAVDADRGDRPLRPRRYGRLSLVGADERIAGTGRGLRAAGDDGAGAARRAQPAGSGGRAHRRGRRGLPDRRRAGDRRPRLRHRDDPGGR